MTRRISLWMAILLAAALAAGCGVPKARSVHGKYRWKPAKLTIELPDGQWRVRHMEDDALLFNRIGTPGYFMARISPREARGDVPTDVLARSLLIHFQNKKVVSHGRRTIVGRDSACLVAEADVNGSKVKLKACSMPLGDRVLDAACWAAPDEFAEAEVRFNEFLAGIVNEGKKP